MSDTKPKGLPSKRISSMVHAFDDRDHKDAVLALAREVAEIEVFIRECAEGWDCDTGANESHPHYCRCCNAERFCLKWQD